MFGIPDGLAGPIAAAIKATNDLAKAINSLADATHAQTEVLLAQSRPTYTKAETR